MSKKSSKPETPAAESVTLIADPFGIRTGEIAQAQDESEAIDEALPADDTLLDPDPELESSLKGAMEREAARHAEEVSQTARNSGETPEEAAKRLAREITEDEALKAQLSEELSMDAPEEIDPELQAALPSGLDVAELESCIETLLFLTDKPLSVAKLRDHLGPHFSLELFEQAVAGLKARYDQPCHGVELTEVSGGLQLRTKPGRAALARKLARVQTQKLSSGAMETLAIVAFRQPVLKEDIDKIRGVDSSYFVRGLLDRKLIEISARSELPGRPMLYTTSAHFLEVFGLKDLQALPPFRELEQMVPASQSANPEEEDPRVKQMRTLVAQMKSDTSTSLVYDPEQDEALLQEIRERVSAIPSSTPYLEAQKEAERLAQEEAKAKAAGHAPAPETPSDLAGMAPLPSAETAPTPTDSPAH